MNNIFTLEFFIGILIPSLINVALMTLLERKWLSLTAQRVGPNKVGPYGLFQPISDVLKLFFKMTTRTHSSIFSLFFLSPFLSLFLSLMMMTLVPVLSGGISWEFLFLVMLTIFSLGVYPVILAGWSSNSKYSLLGGIRAVSQTISYEISMALFTVTLFLMALGLSLFENHYAGTSSMMWVLPLMVFWPICFLAEMHRAPFDFTEGESELVSGFNVEYGSPLFAVIFMSEYLMIFVFSMITSCFLYNQGVSLMTSAISMVISSLVIWSRATLPRYRYDLLMDLAWKVMLPWSLGLLGVVGSVLML